MSNNNSNSTEVNGTVMVLAVLGIVFVYLAAFVVAIIAIYSVFMTFVCFWAWFKPRKFFKWTIYPWEARAFVFSGVAGAIIAPIIAAFIIVEMKIDLDDSYIWLVMAAGYGIASYISACITNKMQEGEIAAQTARDITPAIPAPRPVEKDNDDDGQRPFEFATWDDEDRR